MIPPKYASYSPLGVFIAHVTSMYTYSPQSNDPLTPEQIDMLRHSISTRQKSLDTIKNSIKRDEVEAVVQSAAISHLEATISRARHALTTQQTVLSDLTQMKNTLYSASRVPHPDWSTSSEVTGRCKGSMADLDSQLKAHANNLMGNISQLNQYLSALATSIQEMETEVVNRRFIRDTLNQYVADTKKHQTAIEANIKKSNPLLRFAKNIPMEILGKVFSMRVRADMEEYFTRAKYTPMPLTAMKLSQVCRFWRCVMLSEKALWRFIPVCAAHTWLERRYELLKYMHTAAGANQALVCDLSRRGVDSFGYRPEKRISLKPGDISKLEPYSIYIIGSDGSETIGPSEIPFRQAQSVTLWFRASLDNPALSHSLGPFPECKRLEVVARNHYGPTEENLARSQPQLTYLKLDMRSFVPFDITEYLGPNLRELHITHDGGNVLSPTTTPLRLSALKVLGVTPPDTNFTHSLDLPALEEIVLYGPKVSHIPIVVLDRFADTINFKRMRRLELRSCTLYRIKNGARANAYTIMTHIGFIVEKMSSVKSLRCVDSIISGSELVEFAKALKGSASATRSKLNHIVIDCCTGITRGECDAVSRLVEQLEVYV